MRITATVVVEIDDNAAVLLDASVVGGAFGAVRTIVRNALSDTAGFKSVTVDTDDTDGEMDEGGSERPAREFGDRGVTVASAPRKAPRKAVQGKTARTGRPKTLTDMEASDGEPVREWGVRSPESLAEQGISTRVIGGNGEWTPPLPERKVRRPKSAAPVTKGYSVTEEKSSAKFGGARTRK
jgi:hypothetical protein